MLCPECRDALDPSCQFCFGRGEIIDDFEDDEPDYPKDCFGCYAPGTEECDWCEYADECA